jgi:Asp-tRNA(Asn)/Glu-tRNA(Gln) amidotransferase A subunit family amidase
MPVHPTGDIEAYLGLSLTEPERDSLEGNLRNYLEAYQLLHAFPLSNAVPPAFYFNPEPLGFERDSRLDNISWGIPSPGNQSPSAAEIAFLPVYELAAMIKSRKITATALTKLYLGRLKKYSDTLQCTVTILEERALAQAMTADKEIAAGRYRGTLHGIPYGIKDLLAVRGTKTTWGAGPYKEQTIDVTATVVAKLEAQGAVLLAKLSMGALAWGDVWYGGTTKNPWNPRQGSSGSSAGSASATSAGLVAFAIGTETHGSIVSPSTRCGVTGLRPTYGTVSRYGAMALSWSMDKIGPICRSALDCGIVLNAIRGEDGQDLSVRTSAFIYDHKRPLKSLRVGYLKSLFDNSYSNHSNDSISLAVFRSFGIAPTAVALPDGLPISALSIILTCEAAAAFEELTLTNRDTLLTVQKRQAWPNVFRAARFIPAVEYINANRVRQILIEQCQAVMKDYDVIIAPSFGGQQLLITNLTGHPCLVMPNGFNDQGSPTSISLIGRLYGDADLVMLGRAYQEATSWDEQHPPMFGQ